jgi:uncharacterized alkaline shock family protein YloU
MSMSADNQSGGRRGDMNSERAGEARQAGTTTAQRSEQAMRNEQSVSPSTRPQDTAAVSLTTETGSTRIGSGVVAKIAGLSARDIPGVFSMGSGMARRVGQLRSLIPGSTETASQGVSVEVGEREAAVDLNLVTWYGQSIVEISEAVRRNVIGQVEGMTGLHVVEVNIQVDDIHVPTPDSDSDQTQRVQ